MRHKGGQEKQHKFNLFSQVGGLFHVYVLYMCGAAEKYASHVCEFFGIEIFIKYLQVPWQVGSSVCRLLFAA